jgi:hypothetical protein
MTSKDIESMILTGPPPPEAETTTIDFASSPAPEFEGYFAMTVTSVLTPSECSSLLSLVQPPNDAPWPPATVTAYDGTQVLSPESRHCGRIIHNSPVLAQALLERILPFLPEDIVTLCDKPDVTGAEAAYKKQTWKIGRCNEALKFLKYEEGDFFSPHCDGQFVAKDGMKSYLTAHFYLNGNEGEVEGGATRFCADIGDGRAGKVDVNPRTGSVLVFQQRDMYHEGCEVTKGTKYTLRTDVLYEKM